MTIKFTEQELELIQRALREAQVHALDVASKIGEPQGASKYLTLLHKIDLKIREELKK